MSELGFFKCDRSEIDARTFALFLNIIALYPYFLLLFVKFNVYAGRSGLTQEQSEARKISRQ